MARITVEDCLNNVDNRFELVLVSSKRARQLMNGNKESSLDWEEDKATVVALREIEEGVVDAGILLEEDHDDFFEAATTEEGFDQDAELAALINESMSKTFEAISESAEPIEESVEATAQVTAESESTVEDAEEAPAEVDASFEEAPTEEQ